MQVKKRKQKERELLSELTMIRYHNLTKQSVLIYTNTTRQFLQISSTLPNATVEKIIINPNPQTRGDSIIILIMLFLFHFPQLKVSRGVCE